MERKQGFFSALKDEVIRGLSPVRSRSKSPARSGSPISGLLRRRPKQITNGDLRSGSLTGETLAPLYEGPDQDGSELGESKRVGSGIGQWMKGQLTRTPSMTATMAYKHRNDLRLLLGVMGAPLAPVHVSTNDPFPHLCIKDTPIVSIFFSFLLNFFIINFAVTFFSFLRKINNNI